MQPIILRQDQQQLKDAIYHDWRNGVNNTLAVLSTGGGKSVIASDIVLDGFNENRKQAVIAHRNELVAQMSTHIARRGIPHRIIGSTKTVSQIVRQHRREFNQSFVNPSAPTAVVGVDTLVARKDSLQDWARQLDRWVVDEAHHLLRANKWGKAVEMFSNAQGLGITATPERADGQGLGREHDGVFDNMNVGLDMRSLIGINALSDYELVCPTSDLTVDDSKVGKSGDHSSHVLRTAAKESHIVGDVVQAYCQYAYGRQAIVFATDIETAGDIAKKFNAFGIRAASLSSKTPDAVREKYTDEFKAGKLQVLVNVDLFDEGFDVPACDVVILARPTASLGKYRQMVGRALRYMAGKVALIIDLVSNIVRHGLPDKHTLWTLERRDKRAKQVKDPDEIELKPCYHCTKPYEKSYTCCPYCGLEPPLPEPRERSIEMIDGDLMLLDRAKLEEMRKAAQIMTPAEVAQNAPNSKGDMIARSHVNKQIEKIAAYDALKHTIAQWAAYERLKGFSDRQIDKKFFLTAGVDVLSALDGSRKRQEYEKLTETIKGWYTS